MEALITLIKLFEGWKVYGQGLMPVRDLLFFLGGGGGGGLLFITFSFLFPLIFLLLFLLFP